MKAKEKLLKLEAILRAKKWTQGDLAKKIGTTTPYVSQLILGDRKASAGLCQRIIEAIPGEITLVDLRPDLAATLNRIQQLESLD